MFCVRVFALFGFLLVLWAESDAEMESLRHEVSLLREQVERMRAILAQSSPANSGNRSDLGLRPIGTAGDAYRVVVGGVFQARAAWTSAAISMSTPTAVLATAVNNPSVIDGRRLTFDIPATFIALGGCLHQDEMHRCRLEFQFSMGGLSASGSRMPDGSVLPPDSPGSQMSVVDANVSYVVDCALGERSGSVAAVFGQQRLPFGLEVNTTEAFRPVIKNAQFVSGFGLGSRQIGLLLRGQLVACPMNGYATPPAASVEVGVFNGNGPSRDDDNGRKDLFFRCSLSSPLPLGGDGFFQVGTSLYKGWMTLMDGEQRVGLGVRDRMGADLCVLIWPYGFTYEYVYGKDATLLGAPPLTGSDHVASVYRNFGSDYIFAGGVRSSGGWRPRSYQIFFRSDHWNPDEGANHVASVISTVGVNAFLTKSVKAQVNLAHRDQYAGNESTVSSEEVLAQMQYSF